MDYINPIVNTYKQIKKMNATVQVKVTTSTFLCFSKVRLHTETKHGNGSNINMSLSIHNTSFKTVHHCIVQR